MNEYDDFLDRMHQDYRFETQDVFEHISMRLNDIFGLFDRKQADQIHTEWDQRHGIKKKMTPPIPSAVGGKRRQVNFLKELMPDQYDLYVEPFAGGATLFFALDDAPSKAVLNDVDPAFTKTWQWIKTASPEMLEDMKARKWDATRDDFFQVKDQYEPKTLNDEVWQNLFVTRHSFSNRRRTWRGADRAREAAGQAAGRDNPPMWLNRIDQYRERLAGTKIEQADWKEVMQKYDASGTFFYIDPPYEQRFARELPGVLKGIEGKWLLSFGWDDQLDQELQTLGFKTSRIDVTNTINKPGAATRTNRQELIASNYPIEVEEGTVIKDVGDYSRATKAWRQAASVDDRLSKALDSILDRAKARQLTQPEAVNEAHALIEQAFVGVTQAAEDRVSRMAHKQVPLAPEMTARFLRMKAEKIEEADIIIKDIYLTKYGKHAGPDVEAESFDEAAQILEGSKVVGELKKRVPLDSE